jgi:hypothetical protein
MADAVFDGSISAVLPALFTNLKTASRSLN